MDKYSMMRQNKNKALVSDSALYESLIKDIFSEKTGGSLEIDPLQPSAPLPFYDILPIQ